MAKGKGKPSKPTLEVAVQFGGLSIGDQTARLGVRIARAFVDVAKADAVFVGKRLEVVVQLGAADADQMKLFDVELEVVGAVDVKRIGVAPDAISAGLTFNLQSIDVATLARFSKCVGRLKVLTVADLPAEAAAEADDGAAE